MKTPIVFDWRRIGPDEPVFLIAEAGVNHNGDMELARRLVDEAAAAGADCVKFQTFKAAQVATAGAEKAAYQKRLTPAGESQIEMLRKLELGASAFAELMDRCRERGVAFLSTPYGFEDADLLDDIGVHGFKIASGQAVELPFLEHVARMGRPIFLSTGMCTMAEVAAAVETIRACGNDRIVVLQCTTNYPSRPEDANLLAMRTMGQALGCLFGYSDHTPTLSTAVASVALGACVVERHFTLDRSLPGPDHASSMEPGPFADMAAMLREAQSGMGTGLKTPCVEELANLPAMRRSLVAARDIARGEVLDWSNLCFKRPGGGLGGAQASLVAGRTAAVDIARDTPVHAGMVS